MLRIKTVSCDIKSHPLTININHFKQIMKTLIILQKVA